MKTIIFVLLLTLAASFELRQTHDYWYTDVRKPAETGIPIVDAAWNYCDIKCTSFENYYPGYDFFVVYFKETLKPGFAACYAQPAVTVQVDTPVANASTTPQLWNTIAKNEFFERNCGKETEDYLKNPKYAQQKKDGVGIGTAITYK